MSSLVLKTGSFKRARSNSSIFSEGTYDTDITCNYAKSQYECRTVKWSSVFEDRNLKKKLQGGVTITLGNFLTEWFYSGHSVIFPIFHVFGVIAVISSTDLKSVWCYSGHSVSIEISSLWCYSGQNVGVIKSQNVSVIVTPL